MELPGEASSNKDNCPIVYQQPNLSASVTQPNTALLNTSHQSLEKLTRPAVFDKMEALVREMQDQENGVPVRQQKVFLTSIPYAFMGYDLIEWLMERLCIEESEALGIANQLCLHGYFFPVNDNKLLNVKDDSSLYRFQTPYYWPWQHKAPDNVEYAIYLSKRSLRNKQRHGLEDYESEALASLHKNLKAKWDFISMQAEEQVRLAKERKKGEKIVGDSQERAFWRVHRPPPGQFTPLEPCPIPCRNRQAKYKKRTNDEWQREVDFLKKLLTRTRLKMSLICESLVNYWETFNEYDFILQPALPSNPWVSEDITFWQLNNAIVDVPTEKRVKRWGISIEELVSDPTGLQEFTAFLEKEYSHENIRFWIAVNKLRRSAHSQISKKVNEIYEEFLKPGAPCEINIDGKTMEAVQNSLSSPSRFTFDVAAEHIYALLLKKDCYPRFVRSDHYKLLLASGIQPAHKKRFFGFGGAVKKKTLITHQTNQTFGAQTTSGVSAPPTSLSLRRESDKSLTGSAHELTMTSVKETTNKIPHSHSQSNLNEISYRLSNFEVHSEDQVAQTDFVTCSEKSTEEFLEKTLLVSDSIEMENSITKTTIEGLEKDSRNNNKLQDISYFGMVSTSSNEKLEKCSKNDKHIVDSCTIIPKTKKDPTSFIIQGELSPVSEGSQEFFIKNSTNDYETDVEFNLTSGCVAPVPTPAPSLAPLAEIEMDPIEEEQKSSETDELDEAFKAKKQNKEEKTRLTGQQYENRNPVCPWEDEDNDSNGTTYVKTYATLGYL